MAGPTPSLEQVTDALIAAIAADLQAPSNASILQPVLSTYGVTISTAPSSDDPGELVGIKHGDRDLLPDGASICVIPEDERRSYQFAPGGGKADDAITVKLYWRDGPTAHLTRTPGSHRKFLTSISGALLNLLSPTGLGASGGGWSVSGGTVMIYEPAYSVMIFGEEERQGKIGYFTEIAWQGTVYFNGP